MTVEIIGMVGTQDVSESRGDPGGRPVNVDYLTRFTRAHKALVRGFDHLEDVADWGRELIPRIRDLAQTVASGGPGA